MDLLVLILTGLIVEEVNIMWSGWPRVVAICYF